MKNRALALAIGTLVIALTAAWGQAPPTSAKVDTQALDLTDPDRYQIPAVLEPIRRVTLIATADGIVRSQDAKAGASVREGQEVAQFDRAEASARLKIAQAEVKEQKANLDAKKAAPGTPVASNPAVEVAQARLEAAQARAEIAQLEYDRCTLRAPFSGKVLASPVSDGQYVTKGTVIAELADVSSLRALIPLSRTGAVAGSQVNVSVEGQSVPSKVQAVLPLTESLAVLRELSSPLAAAWVVLSNSAGTLEPGQRVNSPALPDAPIAIIPAHALQKTADKEKGKEKDNAKESVTSGTGTVQVIRNEHVANVKVRIMGSPGPERLQVTGPLRPTDALIVSSSVPLMAGTLIRFNAAGSAAAAGEGNVVQGTTPGPDESGATADLTPPRVGTRTSPIGAPGSAVPRGKTASRAPSAPPATTKPAAKTSTVPF
jgi:RND family efflux transporter MFP subunit